MGVPSDDTLIQRFYQGEDLSLLHVCVCVRNSELSVGCCQLIPAITGEETEAEVKISLWNGNDDFTLRQKLSARTREFIFLCDKAQQNLRKKHRMGQNNVE